MKHEVSSSIGDALKLVLRDIETHNKIRLDEDGINCDCYIELISKSWLLQTNLLVQ